MGAGGSFGTRQAVGAKGRERAGRQTASAQRAHRGDPSSIAGEDQPRAGEEEGEDIVLSATVDCGLLPATVDDTTGGLRRAPSDLARAE